MSNYDSVGVIGGGSWGTTLAHLSGINNNKTLLWMRDEKGIEEVNSKHRNSKYTKDYVISQNVQATDCLEEVANHCEIIIVAIPSHSFRRITYKLGNYVKGDQILLSASKGLEQKTRSRMTSILLEETCCKKVGVIAGPNLFEEILKGHPSATVVASHFNEVIIKTIQAFASKNFRVYGNNDVLGSELGGAVKNIVAIAAGIIDGLDFGNNSKSLLVTRGISEMCRIGSKLGTNNSTFTGLTGVGDTMVTCACNLSRNYRVGYHLAKGKSLSYICENIVSVAEGINTCKVIHEFALEVGVELPIVRGVYEIVHENKDIMEVITSLMQRKSLWE